MENRSVLQAANRQATKEEIDKELAMKWQEMGNEAQNPYFHRFETGYYGNQESQPAASKDASATRQDDTEMGDYGDEDEMYE